MIIDVKGLTYSYRDNENVLENASLSFSSSSMVALLGRNGAGKSTLFKLLLRSLEPKSGEILIDSRDIKTFKRAELSHIFSYIPQISEIAFSYTALEAVLMASASSISLFSAPSKSDIERAEEILTSFGIGALKERRMESLSGGERQLVLLSRALMQKSKFIILDEPTSNLDFGNQIMVLEKLEKLKDDGLGIIYSTHSPDLALSYSSSLLVLDNGKITAFESPDSFAESNILENLYQRKLCVKKIFTGRTERYVCIPI